MAASIRVYDHTPDQRRPFSVRVACQGDFSNKGCRSWALKFLASMAMLSRAEPDRVLKQALKMNAVRGTRRKKKLARLMMA